MKSSGIRQWGAGSLLGLLIATTPSLALPFNPFPAPRFQEAKKSVTPTFKSVWKQEAPKGTFRVALADVMGDKKPRILTLEKEGNLTIHKVTETGMEKEESLNVGKGGEMFFVGQFSKGKPAQILVEGATYYREGEKFQKKEIAELKDFIGFIRFNDGFEGVFNIGTTGKSVGRDGIPQGRVDL